MQTIMSVLVAHRFLRGRRFRTAAAANAALRTHAEGLGQFVKYVPVAQLRALGCLSAAQARENESRRKHHLRSFFAKRARQP